MDRTAPLRRRIGDTTTPAATPATPATPVAPVAPLAARGGMLASQQLPAAPRPYFAIFFCRRSGVGVAIELRLIVHVMHGVHR